MTQFQTEGSRIYYLKVTKGESFRIQAINETGNRIPPEIWTPFLYFMDKDSFFGLKSEMDGLDLVLSPADFVRLFNGNGHHYVTFKGQTDTDIAWLQLAEKVSDSLNDPRLWDHVSVDGDDIIIDSKYGDSDIQAFLSDTISQQLRQKGLSTAQLPYIQHFIQQTGWDGLEAADDYVIAVQLSEPDESPDWSFKVVLRSKRGSVYWTPSKRRMDEPLEKVLPEKWRSRHAEIAEKQALILSLCPSVDGFDETKLYHEEWTDAQVLEFLRSDTEILQAFGIEVSIPSWLQAVQESKVRVKANVHSPAKKASVVGLDQIIRFDWQFSLNGHELSMQDFERLVSENKEFIRIGNEWVRVDSNLLMQHRKMIDEADDADRTS
ncbi:SNF2 helicase-associated domain-containing protein, partial [Planomicrobium okeanokoites]|uniref:SNF2 helicase-associated domain-containing protein n=1 Tax=Planomicrobium okeanokoites TaxID=244 RepID=UPI0030F5E127